MSGVRYSNTSEEGASTPELTVFISYCRKDSAERQDFVPLLAKRLHTAFGSKGVAAHVILDCQDYDLSPDYQVDVDSDLIKQPIFLPIVTNEWLKSESCKKEYRKFLESYGLRETDSPEHCSPIAKRVRVIVLDYSAVDNLLRRSEHAAQTLIRGSIESDAQCVPQDEELRKAMNKRKGSKVWDDWIKQLAEDLIALHMKSPPQTPDDLASGSPQIHDQDSKPEAGKSSLADGADAIESYRNEGSLAQLIATRRASMSQRPVVLPTWLKNLHVDLSGWGDSHAQDFLFDMLLADLAADQENTEQWFRSIFNEISSTVVRSGLGDPL